MENGRLAPSGSPASALSDGAGSVSGERQRSLDEPAVDPGAALREARIVPRVKVSIVVPVYNEEANVEALVAAISAAMDPVGDSYEIICVDDGSRDGTVALLNRLAATEPRLVVGVFRRNFGQTAAMQAGISAARGTVVVFLDGDLQNDPKDIPRLLAKLDEGFDLVAGWRANRRDTFVNRKLPSVIANWLIGRITGVRLHDHGCTLKAVRADVARELRLYGEMHRFIAVMASLIGARIAEMPVTHHPRRFGKSNYGIGRTLRVILDLMTVMFLRSYLVRPMQMFGLAGLASSFAGFALCAYLAYLKLVHAEELANRPLLLLGVLLVLVGVQLLSLGLVAEVLGRTYHEAQGLPPYHVRAWTNRTTSDVPSQRRSGDDWHRPTT
ncbi:MAG: glycosyltransferase family 2 protein [Polyangiaceae bacterium]|nr:glycosyltransferase family 2 protein [Polyangiaceae bacterium]